MLKTVKNIAMLALLCAAPVAAQTVAQTTASLAVSSGDFSQATGALYGGSGYSYGYSIAVDSVSPGAPFIYVRGNSDNTDMILEYNGGGVLVSSVTLSLSGYDSLEYSSALGVDYSGNVYVFGTYWDGFMYTLLIRRYARGLAGEPVDVSTHTAAKFFPFAAVPGKNGALFIAGSDSGDLSVLKFDGTSVSSVAATGSYDSPQGIGVDGAGNVYLAANGGNPYLPYVVKFDDQLAYISSASLSAEKFQSGTYIQGAAVSPAGSVYLLGNVYNGASGENGCAVYKMTGMEYVSSTVFNSGTSNWCGAITAASDGSVYFGGNSYASAGSDFLTVKMDDSLNLKTFYTMDGGSGDYVNALAADNVGNVYATGRSEKYDGYSYYYDVATVKFSSPDGANNQPLLFWAGSPDFASSGVSPQEGVSGTSFKYAVKYMDIDNDAPASGYPRVHVYLNGAEISGSPFAMSLVTGPAPRQGQVYAVDVPLQPGAGYSYKFEAIDSNASPLAAKGYPVSATMYGPKVGQGFAGSFSQPGGVTFDNGIYIAPLSVAVDTVSAGGPFVYSLGVMNRYGSAAAGTAAATTNSPATAGGGTTAGASSGFYLTSGDPLITRTSASTGESSYKVFASTGAGGSQGTPAGLALDRGGNVYLLGGYLDDNWMPAFAINKFDGALNWVSSATYTADHVNPAAFAVDAATNAYVLASYYDMTRMSQVMFVAKFGPSLALISTSSFAAASGAVNFWVTPSGIAVDPSGNVFATGYYTDSASAAQNWVTAKFDPSLVFVSSAVFSGMGQTSNDAASGVAAGPDGSVYVTGYTNNGVGSIIATVKYSNDLSFRRLAFFNAGSAGRAAAVAVDPAGYVYVAGSGGASQQAAYTSASGGSFVALKYDAGLVLRSSGTYSSGGNYNAGRAIAADGSGAAYITGAFGESSPGSYLQGIRTIRRALADDSRSLTVAVGTTTPRAGVTVGLIPFPTAGSPDVSFMAVGRTGPDGKFSWPVRPGMNYLVTLSSPGFSPTVKDQMNDASARFIVNLLQPATKQYYLNPMPASAAGSTLTVKLSGLVPGYGLMGEVFFSQTAERVAYGVFTATDTCGTMEIYNVPPSAAGLLSVTVSVPGRLAVTSPVQFAVPSGDHVSVDMSAAMPPSAAYQVGVSTTVSFSGFVGDQQGNALKDVKVQISRYASGCMSNCQPVFQSVTNTDSSGLFSFATIGGTGAYDVYLAKKGYKVQQGSVALPYINDRYTMEAATYSLRGYIRMNGSPVPYAEVRAGGDCRHWSGSDSYATYCSQADNSAYTDGDGYFSMSGLDDGNLRLNLQNPLWYDISSGQDGVPGNDDDIRVTVSSAAASAPAAPAGNACRPGSAWVLNSSGACVGVQPYVFELGSAASSSSGLVKGYITFAATYTVSAASPLYIDKSSSVVVMVKENCSGQDCQNRRMGLAAIYGSLDSATTSYAIHVASGTSYYISVMSNEWGKVAAFGGDVLLESTDTASVDFSLARSGSLTCKLRLPDGTVYLPSSNGNVNVQVVGQNISADDGDGLREDGQAKFPNLPAGVYDITLQPQTTGFIWAVPKLEGVNVVAGRNTEIALDLEEGLAVQPQILSLPDISTPTWSYMVVPMPSGTKMNQQKVTDLFFGENQFSFSYSTSTHLWQTRYMAPGQYDFYLLLGSRYNPGGGDSSQPSYAQFANFIGKAKNVSVQASDSNPNLGTAAQPIPVEILGSIGQGSMSGAVRGAKIFTDQDYARIFANFESEIQSLIPAVMLYDAAGDFRGFSHAMPSATAIGPFETAVTAKSSAAVASLLAADPLYYTLWGLPPGSYTAVFANPNYPPVPLSVALPADETRNFDFDAQPLAVGSISGVVRSSDSAGLPLANASVYLKHRIVEKLAETDASGRFSFSNLPSGIYRLEVSHDGFVPTGEKTSLAGSLTGQDSASFTFYMQPSSSTLTGSVRIGGGLGGSAVKAGVKVVAYDETLNVESPSAYLPRVQAQTDDSGAFELGGIWPGHLYNISAIYPGKPVATVSATAQPGVTQLSDPIVLTDANPQVTVKIRKSPDSDRKVDVTIKSPKTLVLAPRCTYNLGETYSPSSAVSLSLRLDPGNTYTGEFAVSPGKTYDIHVEAFDDSMTDDYLKMVKDVVYDPSDEARTEQYIQDTASAGGEVELDSENEEYSGIELDAGSLTVSSGTADLSGLVGGFFSALPSVRTVKTSKGNASLESVIQGLMASEVYSFDMSNVQPNKPFTLNLKYDKERPVSTSSLRIYQYDEASGSWREVPGNYTVDPMTGVVSVDVPSLGYAYEGTGGVATPLGRKRFGMSAVQGGRYRPSSTSASGQSGKFAVFTAKPPTGTAYTGQAFEFYNLPNPFSLKAKTVNVSSDGGAALSAGAYTTRGTLIKYHLPSSVSGTVKFEIFNVAGEKVREINDGYRAGGQVYYSEWDGRNDSGSDCASGVYFMLAYADGRKLGGKAHKMALIK